MTSYPGPRDLPPGSPDAPGTPGVSGASGSGRGALNLALLRDRNDAAVLRAVRSAAENGTSRVELANRTGLTAQAISKITARLLAEGLLTEAGRERVAGQTGKPRTLLRLVPQARVALGAELGRHELRLIQVDLTGAVTAQTRTPIDPDGEPGPVLDRLAAQVRELTARHGADRVLGLGLACPGPLDTRDGILHQVTGMPRWHGLPLRDAVQARTDLPVLVEKNTTAAVLSRLGPENRAFVYLGDGVGAGLVLGGRVQRGARTNAGEFGHQCLDPAGPRCACGARGCLEAICLAALRAGRTAEAATALALGVTNLVRLLDVEEITLGGPTLLADPTPYETAIRTELATRLPDPAWQPVTLTRATPLAIPQGAAALALGRLFD
ncbi:ROK family transcriptional regulator [Streptomyces sp. TLI_171]|uniref:ROK family transcriptional regulator n=1 Tax=Streptomyces sp. TLI_171 TaxID=1938859 RepID=UPI000C1908D6|nr:ROK family transcriptional regulator [Streptomyces sp. TLI_171]RKE23414.1 putative NBD/HSP70 family sugar kinase [Streptomyces sp. TLI_171]